MSKIDVKYVMRKYDINKNTTIGNKMQKKPDIFIYEDERRKLRTSKVTSIRTSFSNKNTLLRHFNSPIVGNKVGKTLKVIDGNHRIEAIKQKIEKDPTFEISIWVAEYKDLSRDQERQIYSKYNVGTPETNLDYLKYHFKTIPLGETLIKELPVSVYGSPSKMNMKQLVGAYIEAKRQSRFTGHYNGGGEKMVADFQKLTPEDIKKIKAWYKDMQEIFGVYYKGNTWYGSLGVSVFMRLWYDNLSIKRPDFIQMLKKVFANKQVYWNDMLKGGGRQFAVFLYKRGLDELSLASKRIHFKSDVEILNLN